jgi:hypothetical protein
MLSGMNLTHYEARYFIETLLTEVDCAWSNGEAVTAYSVHRGWRNGGSFFNVHGTVHH